MYLMRIILNSKPQLKKGDCGKQNYYQCLCIISSNWEERRSQSLRAAKDQHEPIIMTEEGTIDANQCFYEDLAI